MALSPMQDLMRRVADLERRRGPDCAVAQIESISSAPSSGGPTSWYHRWRCTVRMLDREFRPAGGVIGDVAILQSSLTPDGTLVGRTAMLPASDTHSHGAGTSPASDQHDHGPGTLMTASVPFVAGDIVMLARARLGTGGFWTVLGKLDQGTLEDIIDYRAGL